MSRPLRLLLLGSPVSASPSPAMQRAAMAAAGIEGCYRAEEVDAAGLVRALARIRSGEVDGANVTIPHKRAAARAVDVLIGDAALLAAANTVVAADGVLAGHNTDALGLEASLRRHGFWPAAGAGGAGLVLGAGGAAAAAALVLLRAGVERLTIAARRPAVAEDAAVALRAVAAATGSAATVGAQGIDGLDRFPGDVAWLVNATPVGLPDLGLTVGGLQSSCVVVDLRYRPRPVDLVAAARAAGLRACDGLEMLLCQGMASLGVWTGGPVPAHAVDTARVALLRAVGE